VGQPQPEALVAPRSLLRELAGRLALEALAGAAALAL
jgi:hypothetical protein